ncbi:acyltransferase family protein [bacterium]|nr:acyltransferase family protein [bacterium]
MSTDKIAYRPEIDGLRAICVLGVILFHTNLGFSGGFVGVDVFFVISGFLISKIVLAEIRSGQFSLVGFWERRIRRIFPAVLFMQATVLALGFLLYFPVDYYNLLVASRWLILGVPNFYYWSSLDYFNDSGTMFPLLHTWSLGVEEQFYVLFPIVMVVLVRRFPRRVLPVLTIAASISFAINLYQVRTGQSATAFFLLPARAWELLLGCILTLVNPVASLSPRRREVLSLMGLGGILAAMMTFDETMTFPGANALLPAVAACLFIASNAPEPTRSGRFLARPGFVTTGKMSFSLYLWHWPLIAFANLYFPDQRWLGIVAALACVPVAHFAWQRIEEPFRRKSVFVTRPALFRFFVVANLGLFAFTQAGKWTNGFHQRVYALPGSARAIYLASQDDFTFLPAGNCTQDDFLAGRTETLGADVHGGPAFFLWGDSHAMAVSRTIDKVAREQGVSGLYAFSLGLNIVPPVDSTNHRAPKRPPNTSEINARMLEKIEASGIRHLILISRWAKNLKYPQGPDDLVAFVRFVREKAPELTIHIVDEVPEHRYVRRTFYYQSVLSSAFGWPFRFRPTDRDDYAAMTAPIDAALARIDDPQVNRVKIGERFFDASGQLEFRDGTRSYYIDEDHLSIYGSEKLLRPVIEEVMAQIASTGGPSGTSRQNGDSRLARTRPRSVLHHHNIPRRPVTALPGGQSTLRSN